MVEVAEGSIEFNRIDENDVNLSRCVKLQNNTVYNFERSNASVQNPNSCTSVISQYAYDDDRDKYAQCHLLASLLAEPAFATLRTKEQLGYIVSASFSKILKVVHFTILVQSSSKDADYLEHRINAFIDEFRHKEGGVFTPDAVELNK